MMVLSWWVVGELEVGGGAALARSTLLSVHDAAASENENEGKAKVQSKLSTSPSLPEVM
jgi:hypothetical protein